MDRTPRAQVQRLEAEIKRLEAELAAAEVRVVTLRIENSDALAHQRKLHREDVDRLQTKLDEAEAMGRALTEQLQRERRTVEHERLAWTKERTELQLTPLQQRLLAVAEEREAARKKPRKYLALVQAHWGNSVALLFALVLLAWIAEGLRQQAVERTPSHPQIGVDRVDEIVEGIVKNKR